MKRLAIFVLLLGLASACGDDDAPVPNDAGDESDGSARAGTGGGMIGRRDAQVTTRDPVPECDPTEPVACPAGQRCRAVVRRGPGDDQFTLMTGCVQDMGGRAKGAPCDPWGGGLAPYRADGLEDELYVDPCDEGLFCSPNTEVRGSFSCQQSCPLGTCGDDLQCVGSNAIEAVCRPIDNCDPLTGDGCDAGMTCYLALDASGTRVLPSCQPTPEMPKMDGEACELIGDCRAGSSCWGPPRLPPGRWTLETLLCRPTCNTMATAVDGDMDAGEIAPGTCADGTMCRGLAASGLEVDLLTAGVGECE